MQETWVWSLGWKDPLEEGMATHSSILAWRIPWTEEPGGLQSKGSQRVGHDWATQRSTAPLSSYNKRVPLHFSGLQAVPCCIVTWLGLVVQTSGKPWFPLGIGTMQIPRSACAQQAWNLMEEVAWNPGGVYPCWGKPCAWEKVLPLAAVLRGLLKASHGSLSSEPQAKCFFRLVWLFSCIRSGKGNQVSLLALLPSALLWALWHVAKL